MFLQRILFRSFSGGSGGVDDVTAAVTVLYAKVNKAPTRTKSITLLNGLILMFNPFPLPNSIGKEVGGKQNGTISPTQDDSNNVRCF